MQPSRSPRRLDFKTHAMRLTLLFLIITSLGQAQPIADAKTLFEEKKYPDVIRLCNKIKDGDKDYAASRYWLGRVAFNEDRMDDAEEFFEDAIEENDKVADYHYWYGSTLGSIAQKSNMMKQGILAPKIKDAFERTVALDPTNMSAHWGLIEFYTQAPGFMGGSWDKAIETAKGIMKIKKAEGYRALAIVNERQEKVAEAEKNFIAAYKEDPTYVYTLSNFYQRQKKNAQAFALFDDILKKNPTEMLAVYQVGKLSAVTGDRMDVGEKCLLQYLAYQPKENEPSHAGANMRLAQIKEKRGNKVEAKKLYETALKMDGNLKEAKEGLARVK